MSRVVNDSIIVAPVSLDSDWTSEPIELSFLDTYSIQLLFEGTATGVFFLEISTDKTNPVNWTVFSNSDQQILEAGDHTWNVRQAGYQFVRVIWHHTSGSGSLTSARFNAKGI